MRITLALATTVLLSATGWAQGTPADYARAESLMERYRGTVVNAVNQTNWIGRTSWLWYRKTTPTGTAYMLVNADSNQKQPAFDQARLAQSLAGAGRLTPARAAVVQR
jgi:hypothetical protein